MPSILFTAGPNSGKKIKLTDPEYVVGRRSDCSVFIPDMRVSRQHARIEKSGENWNIEDLGSNNGTFVNGRSIRKAQLHHDDEIAISTNRFRFQLDPAGESGRFKTLVTVVDLQNPSVIVSESVGGIRKTDKGSSTLLLTRKLEAINNILDAATNAADPEALLEALNQELLQAFPHAHAAGILAEDPQTGELVAKYHETRDGDNRELQVPATIVEQVNDQSRGVLVSENKESRRSSGGTRMGAPIVGHGVHYGLVYLESKQTMFQGDDLDLLVNISAQAGLALHLFSVQKELQEKERLERDLTVARQIQRSLLPAAPPQLDEISIAVHYDPAYEIGGDLYDFLWHDETRLGIVAGDVAGKAISAALYMARLTSELRSRAAITDTPEQLIGDVNNEMARLGDDGMFATLFYGLFDRATRTLTFINAGHCQPCIVRQGTVVRLHKDDAHLPPIGVIPDIAVGTGLFQLLPGDIVVLVSDGVVEAKSVTGADFGEQRLEQAVSRALSAQDAVDRILSAVENHVGRENQSDDITIVSMQVR